MPSRLFSLYVSDFLTDKTTQSTAAAAAAAAATAISEEPGAGVTSLHRLLAYSYRRKRRRKAHSIREPEGYRIDRPSFLVYAGSAWCVMRAHVVGVPINPVRMHQ